MEYKPLDQTIIPVRPYLGPRSWSLWESSIRLPNAPATHYGGARNLAPVRGPAPLITRPVRRKDSARAARLRYVM
eukprot:8680931-Pyramimonas_sp.AAC.1